MISRRVAVPAALFLVAVLALPVLGDSQAARSAQTQVPPRTRTPLQTALRALNEGRYADVDALTSPLDAADPAVAALRARARIARGQYAEAEGMLRPVAERRPASDAALELGLLLQMLTRHDEARPLLERVAVGGGGDPASSAREARALRALGQAQDANALYRSAAAAAPGDPAINTGWGELFLQTHNNREALESFQDALDADAAYVPALIGAARALADDDPPQASAMAKRALQTNGSSADALVFLAAQAIDQSRFEEARRSIDRALGVNPASLEAHALSAALAYLQGDDAEYQAEVGRTLAIAPRYGEVYRLAADMAAHNYLFDDAVALARKGRDLDPENARILMDLGLHLLRTGDEPAARAALDRSWDLDPFSVVTFNLLAMMDTLETFDTIQDGDIVLRTSPSETAVLQQPALRLAHQALDTLSQRYAFTPRGPILIEMFPKHDDFAVRIAGLPGMIGALGACFGRVVTLDSPKARPGEFQWEGTLWHELTHVITLQMSGQRIPRWLTEGISEYEEKRARPEWGRGMEVEFAGLMARKGVIPLADLNAAFMDPKLITVAYYQATQLVDYLYTAFGDESMRSLIGSFATGVDTDTALKSVVKTDLAGLQRGFDGFLDQRFGAIRAALSGIDDKEIAQLPLGALEALAQKNPGSYKAQMALAGELETSGQAGDAIRAYERAAALVPMATGGSSPQARIAAIALAQHDDARAIEALTALVAVDFNNIGAARRLAGLLRDAGVTDPRRLRPVYERIAAVDPFDGEAHAMLGRMALAGGDADRATREFGAVVALDPVDRAAAYTDLAESFFAAGRPAEARKQTLAALEIAPTYARAQDLLLKLAALQGR
ncbi:MAG: tetratricopeptide repeat protein [Acidobacteria bacterium]|nr:tetratricopeptide repeat protein [Acidobacteriota bacterium]